MDLNKNCETQIVEILDEAHRINDWEWNFVDDLVGKTSFTEEERETVDRIYREKIDN